METNTKAAQASAQENNNNATTKGGASINNSKSTAKKLGDAETLNAKARAPKFLLNDDAKAELYSKPQALNMVKIAFDSGAHKEQTRAYIFGLGYTAQSFKAIKTDDLSPYAVTRSGRFSPFAMICALVKYAAAHDLNGEKAAKEARKAERAKLAEAKKKMKEEKAAKRAQEAAAREEKAAKHLAVAKAQSITQLAEAAEAKRKADQKAARRLAKRNK